jgi:hypothetical protein
MKRFLLFFLFVHAAFQLHSQKQLSKSEISFSTYLIHPNEMTEGKYTYNYTVHFKNTGNEMVLFTRCQCPCGCYVIGDYPKNKLMPGDTGSVNLCFYYREGLIDKSVYLHSSIVDTNDPSGYKRYEFKVVGEFIKKQ